MGGANPLILRPLIHLLVKPAYKPHSVPVITQVAIIYLGEPLLARSRDLPGC